MQNEKNDDYSSERFVKKKSKKNKKHERSPKNTINP